MGFHRPFWGCSAFFGWWSFAAALAFSLLPPSEGRCYHRLGVIIALFLGSPFVDKICLNVDFICKYVDIFVTLQYKLNVISMCRLYLPTPVLDVPERIHGAGIKFRVSYSDGRVVDYPGRIEVISWTLEALVSRVSRDSSIDKVSVILSSGRLFCVCSK